MMMYITRFWRWLLDKFGMSDKRQPFQRPTRDEVQATLDELLKEEQDKAGEKPSGDNRYEGLVSEYCCILWWDDSTNQPDMPFTVKSPDMCRKLADRHKAKYRKPVLPGRC
jgi:hypothetical protein